ncbi:tyrosyl-DNA phosphodiesterase 1-like isoform X2 [Magnolia sinica]|nr:tyrosyl-DNA phosphodiesterase 1-like isoform X2 [Magnolia sinica]
MKWESERNIFNCFSVEISTGNSSLRSISLSLLKSGSNLKKWGHMKLWTILQDCVFDKEFRGSPLVYQGYAASDAIPSPQKNVEKDFLKKYWARWKTDHTDRG